MREKQNKEPLNSKGQFHGYQEWYDYTKIWHRGNRINGRRIGYNEYNHEVGNGIHEDGTVFIFYIK